jgi:hypothetical protein
MSGCVDAWIGAAEDEGGGDPPSPRLRRADRERREIVNIENNSLRHGLTRVNTDCFSRRGHEGRQDLLFTIYY